MKKKKIQVWVGLVVSKNKKCVWESGGGEGSVGWEDPGMTPEKRQLKQGQHLPPKPMLSK